MFLDQQRRRTVIKNSIRPRYLSYQRAAKLIAEIRALREELEVEQDAKRVREAYTL
jgi:hypothetical protein